MAFPGTFNISYYKGDTFEFKIYPKDNAGNQFSLSGYTGGKFTIANGLGEAGAGQPERVIINALATRTDQGYVLCVIRPQDGALMVAGTSYVYDVEISKPNEGYDYVYTLLSGTIGVTEQVSEPGLIVVPSEARVINVTLITDTEVSIAWASPTSGSAVSGYKLYVLPNPNDPASAQLAETAAPTATAYTFTGLTPETFYGFGIVPFNSAGDGPIAGTTATTLAVTA